MDIVKFRESRAVPTLNSLGVWIDLITKGIQEQTEATTPRIKLTPETAAQLESEICQNCGSTEDYGNGAKALRYCLEEYAPESFMYSLARLYELELGQWISICAGSMSFGDPDYHPSILVFNYASSVENPWCTITDSYTHLGLENDDSTEHYEEDTTTLPLKIVAVNGGDQQLVDDLLACIKNIGKIANCRVSIWPIGADNEPGVQGLIRVTTPYGPCLRKVILRFSHSFAELVNVDPNDDWKREFTMNWLHTPK